MACVRTRSALLGAVLLTCAITVVAVLPVMRAPRFDILDCAGFYDSAQSIRLTNPSTYLIQFHPARASYGAMVYLFPIYLAKTAAARFWVHSVLLLVVQTLIILGLVVHATRRPWLGVVAATLCLCNTTFVENYYTLFKAEPWIVTGCCLLTWIQWRLLSSRTPLRPLAWLGYGANAIIGVLLVYSIKETGTVFIGVYLTGLVCLGWCYGRTAKEVVARTWWLTLLHLAALGAFIYFYLHLPAKYGDNTNESFVLTPANVVAGMRRLSAYFWMTAPFIACVPLALLAAVPVLRRAPADNALRVKVAWTAYFLVWFCVMTGILVPWTAISPRYYLQGIVGGTVAAVLAADLSWTIMRTRTAALWRSCAGVLTALVAGLLVVHAVFSVLVGHVSEGRVQHQFDMAWDAMFHYVAATAPSNSTVHFVVDRSQLEVMENIPLSLKLYYGRGDIHCAFPQSSADLRDAGLLCCPYRLGPLNYFRLPASENIGWYFLINVLPDAHLREVTNFVAHVPIMYVTDEFGKPQYKSKGGIPAFWDLKRGVYEFGWRIYRHERGTNAPAQLAAPPENLLANGEFQKDLAHWQLWGDAARMPSVVTVVPMLGGPAGAHAVRVENPAARLVGISQTVNIQARKVYRLSASVRSTAGLNKPVLFGGRVALFLPDQPEQQLVWMTEYSNWWERTLVFTNAASGTATVYAHMGYGDAHSTGEFTNIRLERVE